jgi:hypothetical protein
MRQMVLSFAAVIVQHDSLVEASTCNHRGDRCEQKRPVRSREDMNNVRPRQPPQTRQIDQLIENGSRDRNPSNPPERGRKGRIDGHEDDRNAFSVEPLDEPARLNPLSSQNVETCPNDCHTSWTPLLHTSTAGRIRSREARSGRRFEESGTSSTRRHHSSSDTSVHRCRSMSRPCSCSLISRSS